MAKKGLINVKVKFDEKGFEKAVIAEAQRVIQQRTQAAERLAMPTMYPDNSAMVLERLMSELDYPKETNT